ncbi:MAG: hypothetical protein VX346_15435 [Planctomycetota bacterium]|nr:hypothetical protein [Planctomycetota bacterium]
MTQRQFRLFRVVQVVVPAFAVVVVVGWIWSNDWLPTTLGQPSLVSVEGIVLLDGRPLTGASVDTWPQRAGVRGASGVTDGQGRFSLRTLAGAGFRDGATVGTHRVTVTVSEPRPGGFGNRLLSPEKYASPGSTPLVLRVAHVASENSAVVLQMDGELLEVGPPAEKGVEPAEGFIVMPLLLHFDRDRDDRLSRAEYRRIDTAARHGIDMDATDVNQDGYVDRSELTQAAILAMESTRRAEATPLMWETHLPPVQDP